VKEVKLKPSVTAFSFYRIVRPWVEDSPATARVCRDLSWQQRFIFLTDYSHFVLKNGTVQLEKYKQIWNAERRRASQAFVTRIARGAALLGARALSNR